MGDAGVGVEGEDRGAMDGKEMCMRFAILYIRQITAHDSDRVMADFNLKLHTVVSKVAIGLPIFL